MIEDEIKPKMLLLFFVLNQMIDKCFFFFLSFSFREIQMMIAWIIYTLCDLEHVFAKLFGYITAI